MTRGIDADLLAAADALGITGPYGTDLVLLSDDPADHLVLRWRVENAQRARREIERHEHEAIAGAIADHFAGLFGG